MKFLNFEENADVGIRVSSCVSQFHIRRSGTGLNNASAPNTFANVTNTTLAGDVCPAGPEANSAAGGSKKAQRLRPAPYKAVRK